MNFNFRYAEVHSGITYLRFDDTNPEGEEQMYYNRCVWHASEHAARISRLLTVPMSNVPMFHSS